MIDAAILFIHGDVKTGERVTKAKNLAQICGIDDRLVCQVIQSDRWEEYRLDLYALERKKMVNGELGMFTKKRSVEDLQRIADERKRQIDEIPVLQDEAERIQKRLTKSDPCDKHYPGLLTSLQKVTAMLDDRTGKRDIEEEEKELRGGLMKLAIERAKRHDVPKKPEGEEDPTMVIDI